MARRFPGIFDEGAVASVFFAEHAPGFEMGAGAFDGGSNCG